MQRLSASVLGQIGWENSPTSWRSLLSRTNTLMLARQSADLLPVGVAHGNAIIFGIFSLA
jgi:hypothetical protein